MYYFVFICIYQQTRLLGNIYICIYIPYYFTLRFLRHVSALIKILSEKYKTHIGQSNNEPVCIY